MFFRKLLLLFTPVFFLQNTFTFTQVVLRAITFTFTQVQLKSYSSLLCLFGGLGLGFYPHMDAKFGCGLTVASKKWGGVQTRRL